MAKPYQKRTDSTQLPAADELFDILAKESKRQAVRFDFISRNAGVFRAHQELSRKAGSDDSWIQNYAAMPLDALVAQITATHTTLTQYIQDNPGDTKLYQEFYKALVPDDDLSTSEALFVFGARSNARIERATELYKQSVAPLIIISGNSPHYVDTEESEAIRMATYATQQGVPVDALILENQSLTLPDNVKRTIDLMEEKGWKPHALTIVATNFILTRARMEWYKFCPWPITIRPVSAHPQSTKFTAEDWFNHPDAVELVLNEYAKIILESRIDLLLRAGEIQP